MDVIQAALTVILFLFAVFMGAAAWLSRHVDSR